jgi:hypothetical protein
VSDESPLRFFSTFGEAIDARWRAAHYDTAAFSGLAVEALAGPLAERRLDPFDIVRDVLSVSALPDQGDLSLSFGEPQLTVFRNDRFRVDVLFWFTGTPSIHQHAFTGGFHVLHGSSVHAEFDFAAGQRLSDTLVTGRLSRRKCEVLPTGATRAILAGPRFIHSLFHLDHPSVSVVARAVVPGTLPQYLYLRPGVAIDPFHKPPTLHRQLQLLRAVAEARPDDFVELASRTAVAADLATAFNIFVEAQEILSNDMGAINTILNRINSRFGEPSFPFGQAVNVLRRETVLKQARALVKDAELRFCMALLLTVDDRDAFLRLVASRFPGGPPAARVAAWVRRLGDLGTQGFHPLGDVETRVLELSLEGRSEAEIAAGVSGGAGRATEILQALGRMEVIQPLFVREAAPPQAPSPLQPSRFGGFVGLPRSKFGS